MHLSDHRMRSVLCWLGSGVLTLAVSWHAATGEELAGSAQRATDGPVRAEKIAVGEVGGSRVSTEKVAIVPPTQVDLATIRESAQAKHPLSRALQIALESYDHIQHHVRDYECSFTRRELVDGELGPYEYLRAKVRHNRPGADGQPVPYSVYLKFQKPAQVAGREVLYVHGQNKGQMVVRNGGTSFAYVTTELRPESSLAMRGNRYPITEFGFENLLKRLIEIAHEDIHGQVACQVKYYENAKINGRPCTGILVVHEERTPASRFYMARVFVDHELKIPIMYESYDWPGQAGEKPVLLEQYSYANVKLNLALTDTDFDRNHPDYKLRDDQSRKTGKSK